MRTAASSWRRTKARRCRLLASVRAKAGSDTQLVQAKARNKDLKGQGINSFHAQKSFSSFAQGGAVDIRETGLGAGAFRRIGLQSPRTCCYEFILSVGHWLAKR